MRRILFALMSTLAAVVMVFGYRTSTATPVSASTATVAAAGPATTGTTGPAAARTVTGQTVQTRWGPVQVQITVAGGKITAVTVLQQPSSNGRDAEIDGVALPILTKETLQAQSAGIDSVSGATYTSEGYVGSLQSALDQAGL